MKHKNFPVWLSLVLALALAAGLAGCAPRERTPLVVFAAGSLIQPFTELEAAFEAANPDIDVQNEFHGSIQVIRHVTDLHEPIDIVATADYQLIPQLMYPPVAETGQPAADWYVRFASNELGLAYRPDSAFADEINADNWFEVLNRPEVKVGMADPRFDASGYRALMVYKLAESYYGKPTLFFDSFYGAFKTPVTVDEEDGMSVLRVPEVLESKPGSRLVLRGSSIQMLALLESGDLDYAFEYASVIRQHGLQLLALPPELNLGDEAHAADYARVTVLLNFQRFAAVKPVFRGERIGYGITIPTGAPHARAAERYLAFFFGPEGRAVMERNHHPLFAQPLADNPQALPEGLRGLVAQP